MAYGGVTLLCLGLNHRIDRLLTSCHTNAITCILLSVIIYHNKNKKRKSFDFVTIYTQSFLNLYLTFSIVISLFRD